MCALPFNLWRVSSSRRQQSYTTKLQVVLTALPATIGVTCTAPCDLNLLNASMRPCLSADPLAYVFSSSVSRGDGELLRTLTFGSLSTFGTRKLAMVAIPARDDKPCFTFLAERAEHGTDLSVPGTCGRHLVLVEAILKMCSDQSGDGYMRLARYRLATL